MISNPLLLKYLRDSKITVPTNIQSFAIPNLVGDGNFLVQGKTGSGKTLTYLIPVISKLKDAEEKGGGHPVADPKAIILVPTRELAVQVFKLAKEISHYAKLRIRKLVGGDKGTTLFNLYNSEMDILVATPDRLLRALKNKEIKKECLKYLVLDEADQLLESSFRKTVSELVGQYKGQDSQVFLISATKPINFEDCFVEYFPDKKFKTLGQGEENLLNHEVKTYNIELEEKNKFIIVEEFIKRQTPKNGIIFTGNRTRAGKVFETLKAMNLPKVYLIHKEMEKKERAAALATFEKKGGVIVSTDILARGIDIPHLNWVLNFDIPSQAEYYLHRSGRVGRAGRFGEVYNFITPKDRFRRENINKELLSQNRNDLKLIGVKSHQINRPGNKPKDKSGPPKPKSRRGQNRTR